MPYTYEQLLMLSGLSKGQPFEFNGETVTPTEEETELSKGFFDELMVISNTIGKVIETGRLPQGPSEKLTKLKDYIAMVMSVGTANDTHPTNEQLRGIFDGIEGLDNVLAERIPTVGEDEKEKYGSEVSVYSLMSEKEPELSAAVDGMYGRNFDREVNISALAEKDLAKSESEKLAREAKRRSNELKYVNRAMLDTADIRDRESLLISVYGSEGKLNAANKYGLLQTSGKPDQPVGSFDQKAADEYNSIILPIPNGLNDKVVALAALGEAVDPKRFKGTMDSSSVGATYTQAEHSQVMLSENVFNEHGEARLVGYSDVIIQSRRAMKDVMDEYQKGNTEPFIQNLLRIKDMMFSRDVAKLFDTAASAEKVATEAVVMIDEMAQSNLLGIGDRMTEEEKVFFHSAAEQIRANDRFNMEGPRFVMTDDPEEQRRLADEIILDNAVRRVNGYFDKYIEKKAEKEYYAINAKFGIDDSKAGPDDVKTGDLDSLHDPNVGVYAHIGMIEDMKKKEIDPMRVALGRHGKEYFKELYMDALRNTPLYKQLIEAKTPDERAAAVGKCSSFDLRTVKEVEFPEQDITGFTVDPEPYRKRVETLEQNLPDAIERAKFMKEQIKKRDKIDSAIDHAEEGMSTARSFYQIGHKDSAEFTNMKTMIGKFKEVMSKAREPYLEDEVSRKALLEAYKACSAYQNAVREKAGVDANDTGWKPKSPMGEERYKAAGRIIRLAKKYIMDDIIKEAQLAEETEIEAVKGGSIERANKELVQMAVDNSSDRQLGESTIDAHCAEIIALRMYAKGLKEAGMKEPKFEDLQGIIGDYSDRIMEREDFQYMMAHNSYDELYKLATTDGGKMLLPKLAEARKQMSKEEQQVQQEPEVQRQRSKSVDLTNKKPVL